MTDFEGDDEGDDGLDNPAADDADDDGLDNPSANKAAILLANILRRKAASETFKGKAHDEQGCVKR